VLRLIDNEVANQLKRLVLDRTMGEKLRQQRTSRISGFYQKSIAERVAILAGWADLTQEEIDLLQDGLSVAQADKMIENVVGRYALPLGIGVNFLVNGQEYLVPMVVEEPSVVAAVSFAAKLARTGGGFRTGSTDPVMTAQIQLLDIPDPEAATRAILAEKDALLALANTSRTIAELGGGPVDIEIQYLDRTPTVPMMVVTLLFDTRDAMGANAVNTAAETISPMLEKLSAGRALLRILSNLTDRRRAWAEVLIPAKSFSTLEVAGSAVIENIAHANAFAVVDSHRAATHNKGILNGVDALAMATGNDWRAIEAGAHAYAARDGHYRALTEWRTVDDIPAEALQMQDLSAAPGDVDSESAQSGPYLYGRLEMPLAVGIVGGATRAHPTAQVALKILGIRSARELSEVMVAVGLAQNLAALRALASEGIQRGHMTLHARQVAVAAGAAGDEVDWLAAELAREGEIRVERARDLLRDRGRGQHDG
jgi:hydroxymethylglutaryl-CoA reductase